MVYVCASVCVLCPCEIVCHTHSHTDTTQCVCVVNEHLLCDTDCMTRYGRERNIKIDNLSGVFGGIQKKLKNFFLSSLTLLHEVHNFSFPLIHLHLDATLHGFSHALP